MSVPFARISRRLTALLPVLVLTLALLTGCGNRTASQSISYDPPSTPGGRMCTLQCNQSHNYCRESCDLTQRQCVNNVQTQALRDYETYTRQQFNNHDSIDLHPRDFERTVPCDDIRASCAAKCDGTFQQCYSDCGGTVSRTSSCEFLCF